MHINPREVEEGFLLRWLSQSLVLIIKNPLVWIFLITLLVGASLLPINNFFKALMGMYFLLLGIELSIVSDVKKIDFKTFINMFLKSSQGFLFQVYFKLIFFIIMFLMFSGVEFFYKENKSDNILNNIYWIYGFGLIALIGVGFQIFTHLFSRFFSSTDKRFVNYNCRVASKINNKVELFFEIFVIVNITIVGYFFPILVFMLYPLTCSFVYIAFKEIFFAGNKNNIQEQLKKDINRCEIS